MASGPCALNIESSAAVSPTTFTIESFPGPANYDSGVFWSAGDPTRATAPLDGWYMMYCLVGGAANVGYSTRFLVNGVVSGSTNGQGGDGNMATENMHMQYLFAGDYVELEWKADRSPRTANIYLAVTRLPTPLFVGESANGDSGFLDWITEGCNNDPREWWDAANPSRVTVDEDGTYMVMYCGTSGNQDLWVYLMKNGVDILHQGHNQINSLRAAEDGGPTMVSLHELQAGDYLEIFTNAVVFPTFFAVALLDPLTNMVQATQTVGTTESSYVTQPTLTDFDTESVDTNGFHGVPSQRITVPPGLGGDYWVFADLSIQSTDIVSVGKNSVGVCFDARNGSPNLGANNNRWNHAHFSWFDTLVPGDYFDIAVQTVPGRVTDPLGSFLGMVKLDSDDAPFPYEDPCGFVPQIYRWLKR